MSLDAGYDLLLPGRIAFGWGRRGQLGALARPLGRRALLVVGSRHLTQAGAIGELSASLSAAGIESAPVAMIDHEPTIDDVDRTAQRIRTLGLAEGDFVLAIGGGSALDLGKATAAMATNEGSVRDYLEGIGTGRQLVRPALPLLAIPTTAGTGSEATRNAVISCPDPPAKKSLRSDELMPRLVIVDPELTASLPRAVTVHSGMDAITQLIESFVSRRARPVPRALAVDGLRRALPAIVEAADNPQSRPAREAMAHAALLSGIALANSGLGLAHAVAAALGIHCGTPHGLACAVMLPIALHANRAACERSLAELARAVVPAPPTSDAAAADTFVEHITALSRRLGIPSRLGEVGVTRAQLDALVAGSRGNSMDGNPRTVDDDELRTILEQNL